MTGHLNGLNLDAQLLPNETRPNERSEREKIVEWQNKTIEFRRMSPPKQPALTFQAIRASIAIRAHAVCANFFIDFLINVMLFVIWGTPYTLLVMQSFRYQFTQLQHQISTNSKWNTINSSQFTSPRNTNTENPFVRFRFWLFRTPPKTYFFRTLTTDEMILFCYKLVRKSVETFHEVTSINK